MNTIVITGAGRGIGLALAEAYLARGDRVIATYRTEDALQRLVALPGAVERLQTFPLDITQSDAIQGFAQTLTGQPVDILINNAGIYGGSAQNFGNINFDDWKLTFAVNTLAPIEVSLALLPNLKLSQHGKIVAISSIMASLERNQPNEYAYRSTKAALNKAIQCLAHDLRDDNIVVVPVHPGWVRTDMGGEGADISVQECIDGMVPMIDALTMAKTGQFWQYDGSPMAW